MSRSTYRIPFVLVLLFLIGCGNGIDRSTTEETGLRCYFFFIADCPACKASFKSYDRLYREFKDQGVEFYAILSDPYLNDSLTIRLLDFYGLSVPVTFDTTLALAASYNISTTPQFLLLNENDEILYSGSIDDEYYSFGKHRARVKHHYLSDAIVQALSGKDIIVRETEPIGCKINYDFRKESE